MDYIALARTSYFKVKDEELLTKIAHSYDAEIVRQGDYVALLFEHGGIPSWNDPDEWKTHPLWTGEYDVDLLFRLLSEAMADGEGLILTEVGSEGMRYFTGIVVAVTSKGALEWKSLDDVANEFIDKHGDFKFGPRDY